MKWESKRFLSYSLRCCVAGYGQKQLRYGEVGFETLLGQKMNIIVIFILAICMWGFSLYWGVVRHER